MLSVLSLPVEILLPPTGFALVALLLALFWRLRRLRLLLALVLLPLVLLGMPLVSEPLLAALDPPPAAPSGTLPDVLPGAIVILSADVDRTGEPGGTDLGPLTLERERAGAALARRTGLPVLVTGGLVTAPPPVAELMAASMDKDFGIPVRWVEAASPTTWENARFSAAILQRDGIGRVFLVTHAWHMRRSLLAFRRAGLDAVPAPVRSDPWPRWSPLELVPRTSSWQRSYYAMHEWIGLLWYSIRP